MKNIEYLKKYLKLFWNIYFVENTPIFFENSIILRIQNKGFLKNLNLRIYII